MNHIRKQMLLEGLFDAASIFIHLIFQTYSDFQLPDEGGYSGGTIERPALKQLMNDIDAQKIDVIVECRANSYPSPLQGGMSVFLLG